MPTTSTLVELFGGMEIRHFDAEAAGKTLYLQVDFSLPEKDWPILLAAIDSRCTHLLTGDLRHFGALFGRTIEGVKIEGVAEYLRARADPP